MSNDLSFPQPEPRRHAPRTQAGSPPPELCYPLRGRDSASPPGTQDINSVVPLALSPLGKGSIYSMF